MTVYGTVVAFHLLSMIIWIGGLLTLTSVLARVPEEVGLPRERLLGTVRSTYRGAVNVGAILTVFIGSVIIVLRPEVLHRGWLHLKLLLIAGILVYQWRLYRRIRYLEENPGESSGAEFRMAHGILSLLVLAILLLAILQPF